MIRTIEHQEALEWLLTQDLTGSVHEDFNVWKRHLLYSWPNVKKFFRGRNKWLGAFVDDKLCGIYWYTIVGEEMYDGFLLTDPKAPALGIKLGRELVKVTKNDWVVNWSCCSTNYLKFNQRLGYEVVDTMDDINGMHYYLLKRVL